MAKPITTIEVEKLEELKRQASLYKKLRRKFKALFKEFTLED